MKRTTMRMNVAGALLAAAIGFAPGAAAAQDGARQKAPEPAPVPAVTADRFDGDWTLDMACPAAQDAQAFAVSMPASVLNGRLFGSSGAQGLPGVVQVEGTILPDGDAQLQARGRTASPAMETGQPAPGTPFSYDVHAHFDAVTMHGSGRRVEDRPCDFSFKPR